MRLFEIALSPCSIHFGVSRRAHRPGRVQLGLRLRHARLRLVDFRLGFGRTHRRPSRLNTSFCLKKRRPSFLNAKFGLRHPRYRRSESRFRSLDLLWARSRLRLRQASFGNLQRLLSLGHGILQSAGIKLGQSLPGLDPVTGLHSHFGHQAAHLKAQINPF